MGWGIDNLAGREGDGGGEGLSIQFEILLCCFGI